MKPDDRRDEIASYVIAQGQVRVDDLVERFGVSRMTIHRHIDRLAQQGVLRKLHGAVSAQPSSVYESLFRYRQTIATADKLALARAAFAYIDPGQVVMLDDSTTASAIAPLLPDLAPLTVITNSVSAAAALHGAEDINLISLGGQYHPTYNAYIGHLCEGAVSRLRADVLICSASAVSGTTAFIQDAHVVGVKQTMMASSSRRVLLLDAGKFGKVALHVMAELTAFDVVLVAGGLDAENVDVLTGAGVNLRLVESER